MKTEKQIEVESLDWLNRQNGVLAIKIDNSAPFDEKIGARIKKNRFQPSGIPDAIIMLKGGRIFFIEFKNEKGKQRPEQKAFQRKMLDYSIGYYVVRNVAEAEAALEREKSC